MRVVAALMSLLLLGLGAAQQCGCDATQLDTRTAFSMNDVVLYANITTSSPTAYTATVATALKGCLPIGSRVRLVSPPTAQCGAPPLLQNTVYFLTGRFRQQTQGPMVVVEIDACSLIRTLGKISVQDANWMTRQTDYCVNSPTPSRKKCPAGGRPVQCNQNKVCAKSSWCSEAVSCKVNSCGFCSAQHYDARGNRVCLTESLAPLFNQGLVSVSSTRTCPAGADGLRPAAVCQGDPCAGAQATDLRDQGCTQWTKAAKCMPNPCHACQPMWVDAMGKEVCELTTRWRGCQDTSHVKWRENCQRQVGFGVVADGSCQAVKACGTQGIPLFQNRKKCSRACQCTDLQNVNFGTCPTSLGYGVYDAKCVPLTGCADLARAVPHAIFATVAECMDVCALMSGSAPVSSSTGKTAATTPSVPAITATYDGEDNVPPTIVCPGGEGRPLVKYTESGKPGMLISYPLPIANDNRPGATLRVVQGPAPGEFFPQGDTTVVFEARDAGGLTAKCSFTVTVADKNSQDNSAPVSRAIPMQFATAGQPVSIDISKYFSDADADELAYFIADLPLNSGLTIEFDTGRIVGTPSQGDVKAPQPLALRVMASDGTAGRVVEKVSIQVAPDPTNQEPMSWGIPPQTATEGKPFLLDLSKLFYDPNNDPLLYYVADLPFGSGLQLYDGGELSGVPTFADTTAPQPLTIRVMASDEKASVVEEFELTIQPNPENNVPQSSPIPDASATQGEYFSLNLNPYFSDDDKDVLDFYVSGLPFGSGLKLFSSGFLKGTPTQQDAAASQPLQVKVLASDRKGSTLQAMFINVAASSVPTEGGGVAPSLICPDEAQLGKPLEVTVGPNDTGVMLEYPIPRARAELPGAVLSLVEGPESGGFFPIGATKVIWMVEDVNGLTSDCSFLVTVKNGAGGVTTSAGSIPTVTTPTPKPTAAAAGTLLPASPVIPTITVAAGDRVVVDTRSRLPSGASTRYSLVAPPEFRVDERTGVVTGYPSRSATNAAPIELTVYAMTTGGGVQSVKFYIRVLGNNQPTNAPPPTNYPSPAALPTRQPTGNVGGNSGNYQAEHDLREGQSFWLDTASDFGLPPNAASYTVSGFKRGTGLQFNQFTGVLAGIPTTADIGVMELVVTAFPRTVPRTSLSYTLRVTSAGDVATSNGACASDLDCAQGQWCDPYTFKCGTATGPSNGGGNGGTTSVGSVGAQKGEVCYPGYDCASGLMCYSQGMLGICVDCLADSDCGAGSTCSNGSCKQKNQGGSVGQNCILDKSVCDADGLTCMYGMCGVRPSQCWMDSTCGQFGYCVMGVCATYRQQTQTCNAHAMLPLKCQPGLECEGMANGGNGVCGSGGGATSSTTTTKPSFPTPPSNPSSGTPGVAGDTCTKNKPCATGFKCKTRFLRNDICVVDPDASPAAPSGPNCNVAECAVGGGYCSSAGVCTPMGDVRASCDAARPCKSSLQCDTATKTCVSALRLSCPSNMVEQATEPSGAYVTYATPQMGNGIVVRLTDGRSSGRLFPLGDNTQTFEASYAGQTFRCSFTVRVLPL